jgi:hypothetical protein
MIKVNGLTNIFILNISNKAVALHLICSYSDVIIFTYFIVICIY